MKQICSDGYEKLVMSMRDNGKQAKMAAHPSLARSVPPPLPPPSGGRALCHCGYPADPPHPPHPQPRTPEHLDEGGLLPVAEALVIRPGDHLVVRARGVRTGEDVSRIREHIRGRLPMLADVLVLGNVEGLYVVRDHDVREVSDGG